MARLPMAGFCFARNCRGRNFRDLWPDFGRVWLRWRRVARARYWGREFASMGHDVGLIRPVYVKAFVKRQKDDVADAEAVAEAAMRPTMRTVAVKTSDQEASAMLFRTRDLLVGQRTQMVNALWSAPHFTGQVG